MEAVKNNSLTWNRFINETSDKLTKVSSTLPDCMVGFAKSLNVNIDDIKPFFNSHNWDGMAQFLIEVKLNRKTSMWIEPVTPPSTTTPIVADSTTPPPGNTPPVNITPMPQGTDAVTEITSDSGTSPVVQQPHLIGNLPFDEADQNNLTTLIKNYATFNRLWLAYNYNAFDKEWEKVGDRNPLKVLSYL